jgi:hypothetical protein
MTGRAALAALLRYFCRRPRPAPVNEANRTETEQGEN